MARWMLAFAAVAVMCLWPAGAALAGDRHDGRSGLTVGGSYRSGGTSFSFSFGYGGSRYYQSPWYQQRYHYGYWSRPQYGYHRYYYAQPYRYHPPVYYVYPRHAYPRYYYVPSYSYYRW